jgi:hypothetical protein
LAITAFYSGMRRVARVREHLNVSLFSTRRILLRIRERADSMHKEKAGKKKAEATHEDSIMFCESVAVFMPRIRTDFLMIHSLLPAGL